MSYTLRARHDVCSNLLGELPANKYALYYPTKEAGSVVPAEGGHSGALEAS